MDVSRRRPASAANAANVAEPDTAWLDLERKAEAYPGFGPFHSAAWAAVLQSVYRHRLTPVHLQSGDIFLPLAEIRSIATGRRAVSLPFSDFAGPISAIPHREADRAFVSLLSAAFAIPGSAQWRHLELRWPRHPPEGTTVSAKHLGHRLDLGPSIASLWDHLDPAVRRAIRKARTRNIHIRMDTTAAFVRAYYQLHCQTRRRHGIPPQPVGFFLAIQRKLLASGRGMVVLAEHHGRPVAGAIYLYAARQAVYKFGASTAEGASLRANNLVMWHAIEHFASMDCAELHFGRTERGHEGLRRFKIGWGAYEHDIIHTRHVLGGQTAKRDADADAQARTARFHTLVSTLASTAFRHLPLAVNRLFGTLLYPHLD